MLHPRKHHPSSLIWRLRAIACIRPLICPDRCDRIASASLPHCGRIADALPTTRHPPHTERESQPQPPPLIRSLSESLTISLASRRHPPPTPYREREPGRKRLINVCL